MGDAIMHSREQEDFAETTARIRALNDAFRATGQGGMVMLTRGVQQMGVLHHIAIMQAVRSFDMFTQDNDPYGEHDFGAIDVAGQRLFWKIVAYDVDLEMGSPDPTDPAVTCRVMTIMLANEY